MLYCLFFFFFFNDPATPEIYPLPLHAALPISSRRSALDRRRAARPPRAHRWRRRSAPQPGRPRRSRSEEHTSELQSRLHLVCRLLLEKKKNHTNLTPCLCECRHPHLPYSTSHH